MAALSIVKSRFKITGGLACALTSGVVASAGLGLAPTANASCASFFGIGNSADCTSTLFSVAFAIGDGASAHAADAFFGAAVAVGTGAAATSNDAFFGAAFAVGTAAAATSSDAFTL